MSWNMGWKLSILGATAVVAALSAGPSPTLIRPAYAACGEGVRIDGTTAAEAAKKIENQGYSHVRDLKKGCDNYWYGYAMKDGTEAHLSLSPDGQILIQHE